ncbi:hypothetical protein ABL78_2076 [Leptomonas seymouri]|uniref:Uncharacterized protein n=1 Tax=Leptomonas seymouri TaxID=5684 RepID=A0A0N0P7V9_LEPSE|nr:hypothetical protein ABL78_2076 [Leptomonas seymouri]|eukprot:KPI88817.1 hypothetical protein ABL78_2076 [Leptomonas seymouri]
MYPYAPGPYRPRPDANMMAAYCQQQQQQQQQFHPSQQRCAGPWNSNNGGCMAMDRNLNMQGMGYPSHMGQQAQACYAPHRGGFPMQQQQQQLQFYAHFNAMANWHMNANMKNMLPQRVGWAESRPGRTPCKDDWWSHVKSEMQCIESPIGIDLEKEDEHANVIEELQRTGTTSGVVNDGEDVAEALGAEQDQNQDDDAAEDAAFGIDAEPPLTPTSPIIDSESSVSPEETESSACAPGSHPHRPSCSGPRRKPRPSKKTDQGGNTAEKTMRGTRNTKKSQVRRRPSSKDGGEQQQPHVEDDPNGHPPGNFKAPGGKAHTPDDAPAPASGLSATGEKQDPRIHLTKCQPAVKGDVVARENSKGAPPANNPKAPATSAVAAATTSRPNISGPSAANTGARKTNSLPRPRQQEEQSKPMNHPEGKAESLPTGASALRTGQLRRPSAVCGESSATPDDAKCAAASHADKSCKNPVTSSQNVNGNTHRRRSTSEAAVGNAEVAKAPVKGATPAVSQAQTRRGGQTLHSDFERRSSTVDEDGNEKECESAAAQSSGSGGGDSEGSSSSGSGSSSDSDSDEEGSESDEEVEFSTMCPSLNHPNHPACSVLEYTAFRDMSSTTVQTGGFSRSDFSVAIGNSESGVGSCSTSGGTAVPPRKTIARPPCITTSTTLSSNPGGKGQEQMMTDAKLVEHSKNAASAARAALLRSSAQPHTQGSVCGLSVSKACNAGAADPSGGVKERVQNVGAGKRTPPKIIAKSSAAATAAATLPSVENPQATPHTQQQQQQQSSNGGASTANMLDKADAKPPPTHVNEKHVLPVVVSSTGAPLASVDDQNLKRSDTGKECPSSSAGKPTVAPTARTVAAQQQPPMSDAVTQAHSNSNAPAKVSQQTLGAGKCTSPPQSTRKVVTGDAHDEKPSAATANARSPAAPQQQQQPGQAPKASGTGAAAVAASAAKADPSDKRAGPRKPKVSPCSNPAGAPATEVSGGEAPLSTAQQQSAASSNKSPQSNANVASEAAIGPPSIGSSKMSLPALFTALSSLPASPPVVEGRSSQTRQTPEIAIAPPKLTGRPVSKKCVADAQRANANTVETTPATSKGTTCQSALPCQLQRSTNSLSASPETQQEAQEVSPTTAALKLLPLSVSKNVRESFRGQQPLNDRTHPSATQPTTALSSSSAEGKNVGTPSTVVSPDTAGTYRMSVIPRKPATSASPGSLPSIVPLSSTNGAESSSAVQRLKSSTSTKTTIDSSSARSHESSANSALQFSVSHVVATSALAGRTQANAGNPSGALSRGHATPSTTNTATPRPSSRKATALPTDPTTSAGGANGTPAAGPRPRLRSLPGSTSAAPTVSGSEVTTVAVDGSADTDGVWIAEAYDFYAYAERSLSDGEPEVHYDKARPPALKPAEAGNGGSTQPAMTCGGAKRLSTTAGSLADMGYIIF